MRYVTPLGTRNVFARSATLLNRGNGSLASDTGSNISPSTSIHSCESGAWCFLLSSPSFRMFIHVHFPPIFSERHVADCNLSAAWLLSKCASLRSAKFVSSQIVRGTSTCSSVMAVFNCASRNLVRGCLRHRKRDLRRTQRNCGWKTNESQAADRNPAETRVYEPLFFCKEDHEGTRMAERIRRPKGVSKS